MANKSEIVPRTARTSTGKSIVDNKAKLQTVLDFSFFNLQDLQEVSEEEPRVCLGKPKPEKDENGKYDAQCLRLNNNFLTELSGVYTLLNEICQEPDNITWLDVSFNTLTKIDPIICDCRNLKMLYFHGNHVQEIKEIDKLKNLPLLQKLTLHGNPIESKVKGYRYYVISVIPQLLSFDMTSVTKSDRATASTFKLPRTKKKKEVIEIQL